MTFHLELHIGHLLLGTQDGTSDDGWKDVCRKVVAGKAALYKLHRAGSRAYEGRGMPSTDAAMQALTPVPLSHTMGGLLMCATRTEGPGARARPQCSFTGFLLFFAAPSHYEQATDLFLWHRVLPLFAGEADDSCDRAGSTSSRGRKACSFSSGGACCAATLHSECRCHVRRWP